MNMLLALCYLPWHSKVVVWTRLSEGFLIPALWTQESVEQSHTAPRNCNNLQYCCTIRMIWDCHSILMSNSFGQKRSNRGSITIGQFGRWLDRLVWVLSFIRTIVLVPLNRLYSIREHIAFQSRQSKDVCGALSIHGQIIHNFIKCYLETLIEIFVKY